MVCLPAVATTALFIAVILLDLMSREWRRIPGRALFGIFSVLLVQFICEKGDDWVAWTLLAFPFVLLFIGYIFRVSTESDSDSDSDSDSSSSSDYSTCGCPCCGGSPCHCMRPCWMPRWRPCPSPLPPVPPAPKPCPPSKPCPKPKPQPCPGPKPDDCIPNSLAD